MSEAGDSTQGRKARTSKLTIIVTAVITIIFVIPIIEPGLMRLREYSPRIRCRENLICLGKLMLIYACDYHDKYPTPDKWCDLLLQHTDVADKEFQCPGNRKEKCSYAINPNVSPMSNPRMVVLFETKGGWNRFGGPEIMSFENHKGKGCNILFNDLSVKFIYRHELGDLNWGVEPNNN